MDGVTLHFRLMLQQYELQLITARRLARYKSERRVAYLRRERCLTQDEDQPRIDPDVRRRAVVEKVAQELYEIMVFTGENTPVVETIRERFKTALGKNIRFAYPAAGECVRFVTENAEGQPLAFTQEDQTRAIHSLWEITLKSVDENMM